MTDQGKPTIWVLTSCYNDYDQHGEYFEAAWIDKPTKEEIMARTGYNDLGARHILKGGGREKYEYHWYHLKELEQGEGP